ncbi:DUF2075 domain-containing protein [Microbacteriaceae bacterium VKM Ac-2855]|nr:DUF2075 domain-containing protein [Microbacteriaceae bacterium VKM Ac-2855]
MTDFRIERAAFSPEDMGRWASEAGRFANWPVVYTLNDSGRVYVGESLNVASRIKQHRDSESKAGLETVRVVLADRFNKSVCLDLESHLIRWFSGDGVRVVLNRNSGVIDADYYDRALYRETFREVFDQLRAEQLFSRSIPEIENSDLFKLSPFKSLNRDQAAAMENIVESLLHDLAHSLDGSTAVVEGSAGTGKTIVGIYLLKLLRDIAAITEDDEPDHDSMFSEFFVEENRQLLNGLSIALVVPQQSLRASIKKVFRKTPGLQRTPVLSPAQLGKADVVYDLVVVDEAHRLNHRANQPSAAQNKAFADINLQLFGRDDDEFTQLDWVLARSKHRVLLLDEEQAVRPADLPAAYVRQLVDSARAQTRHFPLLSQMRVSGGNDYLAFVRSLLAGTSPVGSPSFGDYDLRFFDDLGAMHAAIRARDAELGLSRLVAGFAWDWATKTDRSAYDIEVEGYRLRWNQTDTDWINSSGAVDQVGSIHTVQGYDLNYAGVIIGADLRFDAERGVIVFDRENYRDKKGKENNPRRGMVYTDNDLLAYVRNIYSVLTTRGMRGTYVYVCDPGLREHLRGRLPAAVDR